LIRGLYTAASGMLLNNRQSDTIDQNLENMNTPGYRQESERVTSFPRLLVSRLTPSVAGTKASENVFLGVMGTGVYSDKQVYSTESGKMRETGNTTDVAINGDGYFVVDTLQGERYTRNGHFEIDPSGMLRTAGGNVLLGSKGAIGPLSEDFKVNTDGTIINPETGEVIDKLRIVNIPAENLEREGLTSLFRTDVQPVDSLAEKVNIAQGLIEEANVDINSQMVKMLQVSRSYAANQKLIQTSDTLLQKAVNEIGRV